MCHLIEIGTICKNKPCKEKTGIHVKWMHVTNNIYKLDEALIFLPSTSQ
jgi:hypothetical protein